MAGGLRKYLLKKLRLLRPVLSANTPNQVSSAVVSGSSQSRVSAAVVPGENCKKCDAAPLNSQRDTTEGTCSPTSVMVDKRKTSTDGSQESFASKRYLIARVRPVSGTSSSSLSQIQTVRCRRLMREFREISRQTEKHTDPAFRVELVEDCLFEWRIFLYKLDPTSEVYADMVALNIDCIELRASFPDSFPFAPPFMRVVAPRIERGFVMEGGSICMELLTPRGWASAYTIEAIVTQFAASLVKGQARIDRRHRKPKLFSRKLAETSFRGIVRTHEKYGWVTPPLSDG